VFRTLFSAASASYTISSVHHSEAKAYHGFLEIGQSIDILLMSIFSQLDLVGLGEIGSRQIGSLLVCSLA
jgi:hypothetical protein